MWTSRELGIVPVADDIIGTTQTAPLLPYVFKRVRHNCRKRLSVSSCMSECPSVRPSARNNSAPTETDFSQNLILRYFFFFRIRTGQERILSFEGGSSRSHYVEESF